MVKKNKNCKKCHKNCKNNGKPKKNKSVKIDCKKCIKKCGKRKTKTKVKKSKSVTKSYNIKKTKDINMKMLQNLTNKHYFKKHFLDKQN